MKGNKSVASFALGCKVNQYESSAIGTLFEKRGYTLVDIEEKADIYIINTCTVTNFGDKKSRQLIRKVKRQNPEAIVAVVGCYAQTAPEEVMAVEGVNLVIGTKERGGIVDLVESYSQTEGVKNMVTSIRDERIFEPLSIEKLQDRTRGYLKIQDGCNQYCSYCIIPFARGPIRSRPLEDVVDEVRRLAENGFQEVVLAGIHVASYGKDREDGLTLLDVIKAVHEIEGIKRIRFSSIEPNIVTEEFAYALSKLPKVCPHFHLSLQSGCDKTLKEMNRKYTTADYKKAVERLRKYLPFVEMTTDVIVGFPGETPEDFQESFEFAKEIGFLKIHVFPYSPKKGTVAAKRTDQIENKIKSQRSHSLMELGQDMTNAILTGYLGKTLEVLFEREVSPGVYEGYGENYIRVQCKSHEDVINCILPCRMEKIDGEMVWGQVLNG